MEHALIPWTLQSAGVRKNLLWMFRRGLRFRPVGGPTTPNRRLRSFPALSSHLRRDIGLPPIHPRSGEPKWRFLI